MVEGPVRAQLTASLGSLPDVQNLDPDGLQGGSRLAATLPDVVPPRTARCRERELGARGRLVAREPRGVSSREGPRCLRTSTITSRLSPAIPCCHGRKTVSWSPESARLWRRCRLMPWPTRRWSKVPRARPPCAPIKSSLARRLVSFRSRPSWRCLASIRRWVGRRCEPCSRTKRRPTSSRGCSAAARPASPNGASSRCAPPISRTTSGPGAIPARARRTDADDAAHLDRRAQRARQDGRPLHAPVPPHRGERSARVGPRTLLEKVAREGRRQGRRQVDKAQGKKADGEPERKISPVERDFARLLAVRLWRYPAHQRHAGGDLPPSGLAQYLEQLRTWKSR